MLEGNADVVGDVEGAVGFRFRQQDGELFSAIACDEVSGAVEGGAERVGDVLEALVAGEMAVGVVDALEVIDVDEQQGERAAMAMGAAPLGGEALVKAAAVGDSGEAVLQGHFFEAVAGLFECLLGLEEAVVEQGGAGSVEDEGCEDESDGDQEVLAGNHGAERDKGETEEDGAHVIEEERDGGGCGGYGVLFRVGGADGGECKNYKGEINEQVEGTGVVKDSYEAVVEAGADEVEPEIRGEDGEEAALAGGTDAEKEAQGGEQGDGQVFGVVDEHKVIDTDGPAGNIGERQDGEEENVGEIAGGEGLDAIEDQKGWAGFFFLGDDDGHEERDAEEEIEEIVDGGGGGRGAVEDLRNGFEQVGDKPGTDAGGDEQPVEAYAGIGVDYPPDAGCERGTGGEREEEVGDGWSRLRKKDVQEQVRA